LSLLAGLALNTIATICGQPLHGNPSLDQDPRVLGDLRVFASGLAAGLYYVSPHQIDFIVPDD
jgi:uncharacterized protein (TIGR03437 family)